MAIPVIPSCRWLAREGSQHVARKELTFWGRRTFHEPLKGRGRWIRWSAVETRRETTLLE